MYIYIFELEIYCNLFPRIIYPSQIVEFKLRWMAFTEIEASVVIFQLYLTENYSSKEPSFKNASR